MGVFKKSDGWTVELTRYNEHVMATGSDMLVAFALATVRALGGPE